MIRRTRVRRVGALATAMVAASVAWGAPGAAVAGAQTCGPAPQGRTAVAVVVDTGGGAPVVRCAVVATGATGADALAAALGPAAIRVGDGSGGKSAAFVCGLIGVPAVGCTSSVNEPTWNYWHASPGGTWRYSTSGFTSYVVPGRCSVEGWSYAPTSTRPRVAPPAVQCDVSPVASAPAPTAAPVGVTAAPGAAAAPTGAAPGGPAAPPAAVAGGTASTPAAGPGATSGATSAPVTAAAPTTGSTGSGGDAGSAGPGVPPDGTAAGAGAAGSDASDRSPSGRAEVATAGPSSGRDRDGSGPGVGLLLGVAAAAGLVLVAVARSRRSRAVGEQVV